MRIRIVAIGILLLLTAAITAAMQNGNDLYQQGLARETAGDIKGAIQVFERIVRDSSSNRTLAAKALLQLGRWSELVGQDQAQKYYGRVIREFADQTEAAAEAQRRLAALAPTAMSAATSGAIQTLPELSNRSADLLAVFRDGSKAIVMDWSKGQNIALYDFSKKQRNPLTDLAYSAGWTYFAVLSPDERSVAYQQLDYQAQLYELRVVTLDGRSRVVYRAERDSYVQPVGWTPDGATLVAAVRRPDKTWAVGTIPATGGRFTPIRSFAWSEIAPRMSPDGRFIAYQAGEPGLRDVHVIGLDGSNAHQITDDPADEMEPIWSPDNRRIAFKRNHLGSISLWAVEVKDGKPTGPPVKLRDGMQTVRLIDWNRRGIFYLEQTSTSDLYTVPMDPIEARPTGPPRLIPYSRTGRNVSPVWSPDGSLLAFVSSVAAEPSRRYVVVMPAEGGQAREFLIPTTAWGTNLWDPGDLRWFGDGHGLGFSGNNNRGVPAAFRLLLETGKWDTIPLPSDEDRTRIEWNRDGSAFYFARQFTENSGIFQHAVNGDAERPVYSLKGLVRSLEFSPDRKWLAIPHWGSSRDNNNSVTGRIVIVDVETGETRTPVDVTRNSTDGLPNLVGWTPSGDLLVEHLENGGAASGTVILPINGGAPRSITIPAFPSSAPGEEQRVAKLSPDGRSMVLRRTSHRWEAFIIENPLATLNAATRSR
jgi:Tol biopolymer transport system component